MGNYKFKLSDMMPNAWFYKLKDMGRSRKHKNLSTSSQKSYISNPRRSIYHTTEPIRANRFFNSPTKPKITDTHFPDLPRKSSKGRSKRKTIYKPSPRLVTSSVSAWTKPGKIQPQDYLFPSSESSSELEFHDSPLSDSKSNSIYAHESFNELSSWSSCCSCKITSSNTDIIIDMNKNSPFSRKIEKVDGFDTFSGIHLRPILTKPVKFKDENSKQRSMIKPQKEAKKTSPVFRKSVSKTTGVKVRSSSPKIVNKRIQACARKSMSSRKSSKAERKSISKSFAIVKASLDPQRDFRDSMVEMIVENNITASKDLEELLACYLSLNSNEYHDIIVKAFEQIWFEMGSIRL